MDWDLLAKNVSAFITAAEPIVSEAVNTFAPEYAGAVSVGEKIIQGAIAGIPEANALILQIKNGTPITPDQIAAFEAQYETDYQRTKADIAAALATAAKA